MTTPDEASRWNGDRVFVVEMRGKVRAGSGKAVVGQIKLVKEMKVKKTPCSCGMPNCTIVAVSLETLNRAVRSHIRKANRAGVKRG